MGYKKDDKCILNAHDDESLFVLMARDHTAPEVVVEWIKMNLYLQPAAKLHEALDRALKMIEERPHVVDKKQHDKLDVVENIPDDVCRECRGSGISDPGASVSCISCNGTGLKIIKEIDTYDPPKTKDTIFVDGDFNGGYESKIQAKRSKRKK
jgi:hypothetical protein